MSLTILHLSDIHFRYGLSGSPHDLDTNTRNELKRDIIAYVRDPKRKIDAVFISGDIAFQGHKSEYDFARSWLDELAVDCGFDALNLFCIPGNHDIDRSVQDQHDFSIAVRNSLRNSDGQLNDKLRRYLTDSISGELLMAPFANYNYFAKDYGCETTCSRLFWETALTIDEGIELGVRGINSALICDKNDGFTARNQLVVGAMQSMCLRKDNMVQLVMCHHPPAWLADQVAVEGELGKPGVAPIQLFGHEHRFQVQSNHECLRLYAGAFQPDRNESEWIPRYNILSLNIDATGVNRTLRAKIYPRTWTDDGEFGVDEQVCQSGDSFDWQYELPAVGGKAWNYGIRAKACVEDEPVEELDDSETTVMSITSRVDMRRLLYSFVNLPFPRVAAIASDLGLWRDEDGGAPEIDLRRQFFSRAKDEGRLADLWDSVQAVNHSFTGENPFKE